MRAARHRQVQAGRNTGGLLVIFFTVKQAKTFYILTVMCMRMYYMLYMQTLAYILHTFCIYTFDFFSLICMRSACTMR